MPNPLDLQKRIKELQEKMLAAQEALAQETVVGSAGGVKVTMSGDQKVNAVEIPPNLLQPEEREKLQGLIATAVNQATAQAQELAQKRLGGITSGLKLPGL